MGDRHGGCFARRGRALNPHRPQVDTHRAVGFAIAPRFSDAAGWWAGFAPRENALLGEGLPTRRTSKRFVPRRNTPHGEGLPTRRTSERICPARERSPRRRPPDTAHGRKDLPRTRTLPTAKASRHGAPAKGFARAGTRPAAKASRHGAPAKGFAPRGVAFTPRADERRAAPDRRTAGKTPLRRGRTHSTRPLPSSFTKKNKTTP